MQNEKADYSLNSGPINHFKPCNVFQLFKLYEGDTQIKKHCLSPATILENKRKVEWHLQEK
jgi:hypothetical protein